ncbi:MAG: type IV pilus secretin PilQ, partial [Thiotrichaceae bacterium]
MKTIDRLLKLALLPAAISLATHANALELTGINSSVSSGVSEVLFNFDTTAKTPKGFMLQNPPRLVLDFEGADFKKSMRKQFNGKGNIKLIRLAQAGNRVRATISLTKSAQYVTELQGNHLRLKVLGSNQQHVSRKNNRDWVNQMIKVPAKRNTQIKTVTRPLPKPVRRVQTRAAVIPEITPRQPVKQPIRPVVAQGYSHVMANQRQRHVAPSIVHKHPVVKHHTPTERSVGNIDFRRDEKGNGRIIVNLPDNRVKVETKKSGNSVVATLKGVGAGQGQKNYNVLDFATPVKTINVVSRGADSQVKVYVRGDFSYSTEKKGNQLVIHVNKVEKKTTAAELAQKKKIYKGDKLTLNFQDIEVRSVLQLLADFTDKNIVVSDTVKGSITLRLKDVPWDQAMAIVLRSKGLGMRENGTVIWVAPEAELSARENRELEQLRKKKTLEPLITEYMSVNFAKASDLVGLIKSSTGKDNSSLLSKRGSISVDERTNTVLVHDTVDHVEDIRSMIKTLDVPVRQVSIESRIVVANDEFSKEIGTRFGVTGLAGFNGSTGLATVSGSANATSDIVSTAASNLNSTGSVFPVGIPGLNDRLNVNLPAAGAPRFGFSILSKDYLIDLELSALQAESKGEIISTPRVVTTNQTKATIEQGVEIPFLQASSSGAANVAFKKAVLSLEVTPQITPDDHVIMDLKVNQDTIGRVFNGVPSINTRAV